jgi:FKBP12-rapamycin complex-associated protein
LGDRHPSNIMLERKTARIVHIGLIFIIFFSLFIYLLDFGECFESAQEREKYPEVVPFRLTRMMINTMDIGIDEKHCVVSNMYYYYIICRWNIWCIS